MYYEIDVRDRFSEAPTIAVHEMFTMLVEARMATILIEKWGMVAAVDGGEDSAGRAKLRLATADEVVDRACETAQKAIARFRAKGWIVQTPSIEEAEQMIEARRKNGNGAPKV